MKMTWLHMQFVLIFVNANSQAELGLGRTAAKHLMTIASLVMGFAHAFDIVKITTLKVRSLSSKVVGLGIIDV